MYEREKRKEGNVTFNDGKSIFQFKIFILSLLRQRMLQSHMYNLIINDVKMHAFLNLTHGNRSNQNFYALKITN